MRNGQRVRATGQRGRHVSAAVLGVVLTAAWTNLGTAGASTVPPAPDDSVQGVLASWSGSEQSDERREALASAAGDEGTVVVYSSMGDDVVQQQGELFNELYPDVDAEFIRMSNSDLLARYLAENSAGEAVADLVILPPLELNELKAESLLAVYSSPEAAGFNPDLVAPDGLWTCVAIQINVNVYNTDNIDPSEVPTTNEEILNPDLDGRMVMRSNGGVLLKMTSELGEEAAIELATQIADLDVMVVASNSELVNAVASGQVDVGLGTLLSTTQEIQGQGAPIDYVATEPLYLQPTYVAVPIDAPHPNAAALVYDFLMSAGGAQSLFPDQFVLGPRDDIEYPGVELIDAASTIVVQTPEFVADQPRLQEIENDLFVR